LVTGAGSGIGRASAAAFAREGATVLAVDIDEVSAKAAADACLGLGAKAAAYQCDVADQRAVVALAEEVGRALDRLLGRR
jgi:NAD(P)-dependent dehydrogenase (short-subunit alcohol dehydrogenase family)